MDPLGFQVEDAHSARLDRRARLWWNSGAQLTGTIVGRLSRAAGLLVSARFLGPALFGEVATALAGYEMLRVMGEGGLDTRLIRQVAGSPDRTWVEARRTLVIKFAIYVVLLALGICGAAVATGWRGAEVFLAVSAGVFGLGLSGTAQAVVTGRLEAHTFVPYQVIAGLIFLAIVVVVASKTANPVLVALAIGIGDTAGGAVAAVYLRRTVERPQVPTPPPAPWVALREALPIGAVAILATTYARLGIALLAHRWGPAGVAQYGVSYRVVEVFLLASSAVAGSVYAVTAQAEATGGTAESRNLLADLLQRMGLAILAVGVAAAVAATGFPLAFGRSYMPAVATTRVLAFALPPMFVNSLLTAHLYGRGEYRRVLEIALINLATNVVALVILVPTWGPVGVAMAVVLTECGNTVLQSRAARVGFGTWSWRIAALSLVGGATAFLKAIHDR